MGNLLGSPFRPYVNGEIVTRQTIQGIKDSRSLDVISYLSNRNAWIKLASAVYIDEARLDILKQSSFKGNSLLDRVGTGYDLALNNVLQGGLQSKGNINEGANFDESNRALYDKEDDYSQKFRNDVINNTLFYQDNPLYLHISLPLVLRLLMVSIEVASAALLNAHHELVIVA